MPSMEASLQDIPPLPKSERNAFLQLAQFSLKLAQNYLE